MIPEIQAPDVSIFYFGSFLIFLLEVWKGDMQTNEQI